MHHKDARTYLNTNNNSPRTVSSIYYDHKNKMYF